ncbi:hypothetical protein B0T10DRAFT_111649 [Thelonectria olida]|uniref:DUF7905 domain-containing protein n=1 Tax=Thelonectria olida TaxID=1576542 RepID=A0A9P8WIA5_9HYPO|nr:hypothetical protein B0T10DRAFT_111649 [Thelonectria olida]
MSEFVEFYITANPPLLPVGVELTISHVKENVDANKLMEILYEPEVPWFKVITATNHQNEVSAKIQSFLDQLLEDEIALIDDAFSESSIGDGIDEPRGDVNLVAENPHVVPWSLYQRRETAGDKTFDEYRFPETIRTLTFKTVWRGLELFDGLTISGLLSGYDFLYPDPTSSLEKIGELTHCELTYNMKADLVYIGSKRNSECLAAAIQKLDNLVSLYDARAPNSLHLIFTESEEPPMLSFRYFTHLGLDKITYSNGQISEGQTQHHPLSDASTLRANASTNCSNPAPHDNIRMERVDGTVTFRPEFRPFADFEYQTKRAGSIPVTEPKKSSSVSCPLPSEQSETTVPQSLSTIPKESQKQTRKTSDAGSYFEKIVQSLKNGKDKSPAKELLPRKDAAASINDPRASAPESLFGNCKVPPGPVLAPMTATDRVKTWMTSLEEVDLIDHSDLRSPLGPSERSDPVRNDSDIRGTTILNGLEHGFNSSDERFGNRNQDAHLADNLIELDDIAGPLTPKPEPRASSACLLDSGSPPMTYGMFYPMNLAQQEEPSGRPQAFPSQETSLAIERHLIDQAVRPIYTPALMDTFVSRVAEGQASDSTPSFQRKKDGPKQLFETMRQKAGAEKSWAQIASSTTKKKQTQESLSLGANVVVRGPFGRSQASHTELLAPRSPRPLSSKTGPSVCASLQKYDSPTKRPLCEPLPARSQPAVTSRGNKEELSTLTQKRATRRLEGLTQILSRANKQAKEVLDILQVTPGGLRLEARLGRLCINDLSASVVNTGTGDDPSWEAQKIQDAIDFDDGRMGFHTVLTTNGAEADLLPSMVSSKGKPWGLCEKKVWYDFVCESKDGGDRMTVEVDASTFVHLCRSTAQELPGIYIHCAKRAWDVHVEVTRIDHDEVPEDFRDFARSLVKSLSISPGIVGQLRIEAEPDNTSRWRIEKAKVRHIAKYRSTPTSQTYLAITMTRAIRANRSAKYQGATMQVPAPGKGPLTQWFEASVGSTKADQLLSQNAKLGFGDRTTWTPDQLVQDGAIKSICEHALRMVTQMDQVGSTNHNSEGPSLGQESHGGRAEHDSFYVFW